MKYDLIIIGGGAGGFAAAIKANELGIKTLMVNSGLPLGGTCVNVGCVPSKFLIHKSKISEIVSPGINFEKIVEEEIDLVERLRKEKYENVLKNLKNVDFIEGKAKFVGENEVEISRNDAELTERFQAERFILAVGSSTTIPSIEGLKEVGYLTHITALKIKKLPKEIVIIGAGPVGLEFGQMLRKFGSEVFILERWPEILRGEKELLQRLREILIKEGIKIETNVKVKKVYQREKKVVVYEKDGKEYQVEGEEILLATGKTPNTQDLDLEKAKVEIDENKAIKVNEYLQTSNPNIFAVGDCNNLPLRLETTAAHEGTIAVLNAFNNQNVKINYREVPWTVFTEPEIAGVGYTEEEVLREFKTCACRILDFSLVPKALIINRTEGMIKMVINPQTKQILGIHLLAPQAGDLIYSAVLIIRNKMTIDEVIETLPVFPTISEAIKLCALSFYKDLTKLSCCI